MDVIPFPGSSKGPAFTQEAYSLRDRVKDNVFSLPVIELDLEESGLFIHESRLWVLDTDAVAFFDALAEKKRVLICNPEEEISAGSILKIASKRKGKKRYSPELSVADFVRLTEAVPKSVPPEEFGGYVLSKLAVIGGIEFSYENGIKGVSVNPAIEGEDENFHPEEMPAAQESEDISSMYWLLFPIGNEKPIVIAPVDIVDIDSLTVLDMLCIFRKNIQSVKYSPKAWDYVELHKTKWSDSEMTPISLLALDSILRSVILKKFLSSVDSPQEELFDSYLKQRVKLSKLQSEEQEKVGRILEFKKK